MEILNSWDTHFLLSLGVIFIIFLVFYFVAAKKQDRIFSKADNFLKGQESINQQLNLMIKELRQANRLLTELAGMTYTEGAGAVESEPLDQNKLYVGNIDYSATESELASYFSQYGQVEFVNIPVNRYTGKARGFGFVTFASKEGAERAMALHGTEFKGRQIQVNFAKERDSA